MIRILAILFLLNPLWVVCAEVIKELPKEFRGRWAPTVLECSQHPATKDDYPNLISISAQKIIRFESKGQLVTAVLEGNLALVDYNYTIEDYKVLHKERFKLSADQTQLFSMADDGELLKSYVKCF